MIIYFLKFLFIQISRRFSPLSRPILLHMPGSPCVWTTPCLLRSPYPAASTTGRFRKVQMTLQCWGGCVHWHQWKVDFAAGILQYMCLSWGLRSDGIIPLRIWGLKNNTVQVTGCSWIWNSFSKECLGTLKTRIHNISTNQIIRLFWTSACHTIYDGPGSAGFSPMESED